VENLTKKINAKYLIVTRGSHGSLGFSQKNGLIQTPALATMVVDRIGAGDAFFAYTSCCFAKDIPEDIISFVGNAVGAIAVQIVCNREAVPPEKLYEFIDALLR
ncbi:TPA: cytidyltransferase, partial [bacterium]|nr:cytidyltransferase [bacterium]